MQPVPPTGLRPFLALALLVVGVLGVTGYVYWIHRDASLRGSDHAVAWAIGALLLGPLVLPFYLPRRPNDQVPDPPSTLTKALASVGVGLWVSVALGALFLSPDPFSQLGVLGSLVVTAPLAYVLIFLVVENARPAA